MSEEQNEDVNETWDEFKNRALQQFAGMLEESQRVSTAAGGEIVAMIKIGTEFSLPAGEWGSNWQIEGVITSAQPDDLGAMLFRDKGTPEINVDDASINAATESGEVEANENVADEDEAHMNAVMTAIHFALIERRKNHPHRDRDVTAIVVVTPAEMHNAHLDVGVAYGIPVAIIPDLDQRGVAVTMYEAH